MVDDVLAALTRLRDDKELRKAIVTNGQIRVREVQPEALLNRWNDFLFTKQSQHIIAGGDSTVGTAGVFAIATLSFTEGGWLAEERDT
jgi:hypothetical protein